VLGDADGSELAGPGVDGGDDAPEVPRRTTSEPELPQAASDAATSNAPVTATRRGMAQGPVPIIRLSPESGDRRDGAPSLGSADRSSTAPPSCPRWSNPAPGPLTSDPPLGLSW